MKKANNYLLEGQPGSGKTTVIKKIIQKLPHLKIGGFYTEEIRESGHRTGFQIRTLSGKQGVLAHVNFNHGQHVGKYGVDVLNFEELVIPCLKKAVDDTDLIVIDEIGKMELFSERFKRAVMACLYSDVSVVATIMIRSHPFADEIKMRPDVKRLQITRETQAFVIEELFEDLT